MRKLLIYITNLQRGRYLCSPELCKTHKQNVDTTGRHLHRQHVQVVCPSFLIRHPSSVCIGIAVAIGFIGEGICPAIAVCMGTAIGCEDIWADAVICAGIWVAICCPLALVQPAKSPAEPLGAHVWVVADASLNCFNPISLGNWGM